MGQCSRRNFLKTGLAAGVLAGTGSLPVRAAVRGKAMKGRPFETRRTSGACSSRFGSVLGMGKPKSVSAGAAVAVNVAGCAMVDICRFPLDYETTLIFIAKSRASSRTGFHADRFEHREWR